MISITATLRLIPIAAVATGCFYSPPERLCDRLFISWAFPEHELSAADDVSADPGLQIDVVLNSELPAGRPATLFVTGPDEVEVQHPETARVGDDGRIVFSRVDVPTGSVLFRLQTDDGCRLIETADRRFVLDGLGVPACEISFDPEPVVRVGLAPALVFNGSVSAVPGEVDIDVEVFTRRTDSSVTLLVTDVGAATTETLAGDVGASAQATFSQTLADGRHAIRAICESAPGFAPLSTATFSLVVDTTDPDCELIAPSAAVTAADDIDPATPGVQIQMIGGTTSVDALGGAGGFIAGPGGGPSDVVDGEPINQAGQSTAIVTVSTDPGEQTYTFLAFDIAGNLCQTTESF